MSLKGAAANEWLNETSEVVGDIERHHIEHGITRPSLL